MAETNVANIWRLMTQHKLILDPDTINDDMSCIICKELMADACHSVCGCQYCRKCIYGYIRDRDNFCPGGKASCKDEYLSLDKDVVSDRIMNNKIFKSKVLCPNESCKAKIELSQMHEHLRMCTKPSMECPYVTVGCENGDQTKDAILTHLNTETLPHAALLLDYIRHLKNEVEVMQSQFDINKVEIDSLKEDLKMKDVILHRKIKEEVLNLMNEIKSVKEKEIKEIAQNMNKQKTDTNAEVINLKKEIESAKEVSKKIAQNMNKQKTDTNAEVNNLRKEIESAKEVSDNRITTLEKQLRKKPEKQIIDKRETRLNDWIKSCPNIDADFIWKIDGWKRKRRSMKVLSGTDIYSESFYSKNYKLCLHLRIYGDDNIWLGCEIKRGDNDDNVLWPMRHGVTLSIIDRDTRKAHKSVTYKYDTYKYKNVFDRPQKDVNDGIDTNELIKYSSIKDDPSIFFDDSIVVSCIFTDP